MKRLVAQRTIQALRTALDLYIPEYRRAFVPVGIVLLKFDQAACPALTQINRQIAHMEWIREESEYREMAIKVWKMREKRLETMIDLALEDELTDEDEKEEINELWKKVVDTAYPSSYDECKVKPGYF